MKRFVLKGSFSCDVLIFDVIGEHWLKACIPNHASIHYLNIRNSVPFILNATFFFRLLKLIFFRSRPSTSTPTSIYLTALLDQIAPKVLITAADNNVLIANYARTHPQLTTVFVQNAIRDTAGSIKTGIVLPTYFALGDVERTIFEKSSVQCSQYISVGSVKLGIALRDYDKFSIKAPDLSFISHYRPKLPSCSPQSLEHSIESINRMSFQLTCRYAALNNLSLAVLSKTRDKVLQETEFEYFKNLADGHPIEFIRGNKSTLEFSTYFVGLASKLVIHPASTLGFELFSVGRKVLFCASAVEGLISKWGIQDYFKLLPNFVLLENLSLDNFSLKASNLLEMPKEQYEKAINSSAKRCVAMTDHEYPHEYIQRWLESRLTNDE